MQFGFFVLIAVVLFAWIKGGPGERVGSSAVAIAWIGCEAVQLMASVDARPMVFLGFDFLLATVLLIAALRFPSFWLGATMMVQAFVLAVHAFHLEDGVREEGLGLTYIAVLNVASYVVLCTIAASTAAVWLKRRKSARDKGALSPSPRFDMTLAP